MESSRQHFEQEEALDNATLMYDEHCLDPLMDILSKYRSLPDLMQSIAVIHSRLDCDNRSVFLELLLYMATRGSLSDWACKSVVHGLLYC